MNHALLSCIVLSNVAVLWAIKVTRSLLRKCTTINLQWILVRVFVLQYKTTAVLNRWYINKTWIELNWPWWCKKEERKARCIKVDTAKVLLFLHSVSYVAAFLTTKKWLYYRNRITLWGGLQVKNRHKLVIFETFSVYQQVNELTEAGLLFMEVNFDGYFWNGCEWLAVGGNV